MKYDRIGWCFCVLGWSLSMTAFADQIALQVDGGDVARDAWPITQGVPFAPDQFPAGTPVCVVTAAGEALPTQSQTLATWSPDGKFVKWLLVDFQADVAAEPTDVTLEVGRTSPLPAQAVTVDDTPERVVIDTGPMQLELRRDSPNFFGRLTVDGRETIAGTDRPHLHLVNQDNHEYRSSWSKQSPTIEVEEAGPLRACVRISGIHTSKDGREYVPYTLRIHLFAGKTDLRIFETFVYDGDVGKDTIKQLGLRWPVSMGKAKTHAFAGQDKTHRTSDTRDNLLLQETDEAYEVRRDNRAVARGTRGNNWAHIDSTQGSVTAVMRDMHLLYPKAIALQDDTIDLQLYPAAMPEPLTFTTPFMEPAIYFNDTHDEETFRKLVQERPTAPLALKSLIVTSDERLEWVERMIAKYCPDRAASHNDVGTSSGLGAAFTQEIWLRFEAPGSDAAAADELARAVHAPALAMPPADYVCATGVNRDAYAAGDPAFVEVDELLDELYAVVVNEPREVCRRYGMWMYGSLMCSHTINAGVAYAYHKDRDPMFVSRFIGPYNNEANDQIWSVWSKALHTGRREDILLAQTVSRQAADCAFIHSGRNTGLMHYHNAHVWSGSPSPSHTLTSGLMLDYYLSGNRRLLDVSLEAADWAVRTREPANIVSNRGGELHREFVGPVICLLEAYKATWDPTYGELARRSINWLLKTAPEPGVLPVSVFTAGDNGDEAIVRSADKPGYHFGQIYAVYYDALQLFDSPLIRASILAEADHMVWQGRVNQYYTRESLAQQVPPAGDVQVHKFNDEWYYMDWPRPDVPDFGILCIAYDITGDMIYAACAKYLLEKYFTDQAIRNINMVPMSFTSVHFGQPIPALESLVRRAMDDDSTALEAAELRWRAGRAESGLPVYDGPFDWLPRTREYFEASGFVIGGTNDTEATRMPSYRPHREKTSLGIIDPETP